MSQFTQVNAPIEIIPIVQPLTSPPPLSPGGAAPTSQPRPPTPPAYPHP